MDTEKLKLIVENLESLIKVLKSEIYSKSDSHKLYKEPTNDVMDYDEVFDDDDCPD